jgi:NET1-associated nuclear protein 1 (U3 small nucleolar RNA-associated protein 17)
MTSKTTKSPFCLREAPFSLHSYRYLILTYNTSVQIYTTSDSLLLRRIPIGAVDTATSDGSSPANIVATRLSIQNPEYLWVACSDGQIYHVKWTEAAETHQSFKTVTGTAKAMTVTSTEASGAKADVVVVVETAKSNKTELTAYGGDLLSSPVSKHILSIKKPGNGLHLIEATQDGLVLVGAVNDSLFIGVASHEQTTNFEEIQYDFFSFDVPDIITTLDFRVYQASALPGAGSKGRRASDRVVDVIVGGARGGIYLYHDALARSQSLGKAGIQAQKFHWHRKAVHSVKWSRDGMLPVLDRLLVHPYLWPVILTLIIRQLHDLRRLRKRSCAMADGHSQEKLPPAPVRQRRKHCCFCQRIIICRAP